MTQKLFQYGFITLAILAAGYVLTLQSMIAKASAPSGLAASNASSTAYSLSTTAGILFATSTGCSARIISTQASPLMLTFSDYAGQIPTAMLGHVQAASTTVAYDSGIYGCGLVRAYSFTTATSTVTETK